MATSHDDPRWGAIERENKAEQILRTLRHFAGDSILKGKWLDMGCGSGGIAAHLAPHVQAIVGVDPEPWTRWHTWEQQHPNLCFIQADFGTLDLPPASLDVITCNQVYEHVPDAQALIRRIYTLLKPGGVAYFAGPNLLFPIEPHVHWPFVHWLPRKLAIALMTALGSRKTDDLDAYSTHYWRLTSWIKQDFNVINALPYLVKEVIPSLKYGPIYKSLRHCPTLALQILTPISPGFVFIIGKPE